MGPEQNSGYAHLPDELLVKILDDVPQTVQRMNSMFDVQEEPLNEAMKTLRDTGKVKVLSSTEFSRSLIAVDGSNVIEKMTGTDILLAMAVGVEGLSSDPTIEWGEKGNQYYQWHTVLPHGDANARLAQGVMFLMELSVLAQAKHDVRIMDGNHFTSILKINSLLSAKEENAGKEYTDALRDFLRQTYNKIIPDIPEIIRGALADEGIVAMAKYSSSRDVLDSLFGNLNIKVDDKTFFSLGLKQDEYLVPMPVGQSEGERTSIWDDLHIRCNLDIPERNALNAALEEAIRPIKTRVSVSGGTVIRKESDLYFTYYKPYQDGPAYRFEVKKKLAQDPARLERTLLSIKRQIIFPEIREPYPQYLADLMAKSIYIGLGSIKDAIKLSPDLKIEEGKLNLLFEYRT